MRSRQNSILGCNFQEKKIPGPLLGILIKNTQLILSAHDYFLTTVCIRNKLTQYSLRQKVMFVRHNRQLAMFKSLLL